jgi:Siphovirus Gp157
MRLCDLMEQYRNILEAIEATCDEGGVIDPELVTVLNGVTASLEEKLANYAGMIVSLTAQKKIIDGEIDRLERQSVSADDHIRFLKQAAMQAMTEAGLDKIEVGIRKLRIQANSQPALTIADPSKVPDEYWYQPPKEIDNEGLRSALKAGVPVEGCELVTGKHIRVS